jgi:DNA replication protein DnaC
MEDGKKELYIEKIDWEIFVSEHKKYKNARLENLHAQLDQAKFAYQSLIKTKDYRGLRLHGGMGVGKTQFFFAIIRDLIENHNMKREHFEYVSEEELFLQIKGSFGYSDSSQTLEKLMRRLRDVNILFYDDLGAAAKTVGGDWGKQVLMEIFNPRYKDEKTTFITSNLSLDELTDLVGGRVADRLQDMHSIFVKGDSLRGEWKKGSPP